jgi:predicted nucleotidyltransferase
VNELSKLKALKDILFEKFGIEEIAIFGSVARDEAREDSDIDIAIMKIKEKNYFKRVQAKYFLEEELKRKVDIGYFDSMRYPIQQEIEKDMIYV